MKTTNYSLRLNPDIKAKAEETFAMFGLNLSEAINVFLHTAILRRGFPFELINPAPNEMLLASFSEAELLLANPNARTFATVEELNAAMDAEDEKDGIDV